MKQPIVLCILDGVGMRESTHGNAVKMARMPHFDFLWNTYPHSLLEASGPLVGLPEGQMGNSEVGHMNIGAGRIMYQPLELINTAIKEKTFFENEELLQVINHVKEKKSKLHLFGLLSDGGIHSHINHLFALLDMCKAQGVEHIYLHLFMDGRDTLPDAGLSFIKKLEDKLEEIPGAKIATISGRYYAMDRDNRWDRVEKAYKVITEGVNVVPSLKKYVQESYENKVYDEFIEPATICQDGPVENQDGLIVFNFRPDRLRELFQALSNKEFNEFETKSFEDIEVVTMMKVSEEVKSTPAFHLPHASHLFGQVLSQKKKKQLRIAETEKYAHVTYFFDGGSELELWGSNRILIPSPKVATYDLKPEMSATLITSSLLKELDKDLYDVVILNYANGDMVGHTGDMKATVQALETVDACLGKLYQKIEEKKGILIVTADHGNSDTMLDEQNRVVTSHSKEKVPFIVTKENIVLKDGKLGDIAPTILYFLGIEKPVEMSGEKLIVDK